MKNHSTYNICEENIDTSWVPAISEYILGVVGNVIALLLLWTNRRIHHWNSFYKLFTGLALTDFLGVFIVYPFVTWRYASDFTWCYPQRLCQFVSFVFVCAHMSSALLICAMSIDRYLNLAYPHFFQSGNEGRKYTIALVGIWITACVFSMLHLVGVGESELFYPGSWCYFGFVRDTSGNRIMSYLYSITGFIIVLTTITINAVTVFRMCNDPIEQGILLDANIVSGMQDSHVMIFIVAITIVFFILWTPLLVDVFLHAADVRRENNALELWLLRMTVFNAIVDPWLYIVLRGESLRKISELCQRCRRRRKMESDCRASERQRLVRYANEEEPGEIMPTSR